MTEWRTIIEPFRIKTIERITMTDRPHREKALLEAGLPAAAVQMLYHFDNALGLALAGDGRLGAIGFTGSRNGGLALKAAADRAGVLCYAELSSVNPVFLLLRPIPPLGWIPLAILWLGLGDTAKIFVVAPTTLSSEYARSSAAKTSGA